MQNLIREQLESLGGPQGPEDLAKYVDTLPLDRLCAVAQDEELWSYLRVAIRRVFEYRNGTAVIYVTPLGEIVEEYYSENRLHREDGPAVVTSSGEKRYYIGGVRSSVPIGRPDAEPIFWRGRRSRL